MPACDEMCDKCGTLEGVSMVHKMCDSCFAPYKAPDPEELLREAREDMKKAFDYLRYPHGDDYDGKAGACELLRDGMAKLNAALGEP